MIENHVFSENGVKLVCFFINDLKIGKEFMSFDQFIQCYGVRTNYLEYFGLLNAIPQSWKSKIKNSDKLESIENDLVIKVKNDSKSCKFFYKHFLSNIIQEPDKITRKWSDIFNTDDIEWPQIFLSSITETKNNKINMLQFKILHRIVATNTFLLKCNKKETELCSFCNETRETITHLFFSCNLVRNIWLATKSYFNDEFNLDFPMGEREIILGCNSERYSPSINSVILMIKYYIYRCKIQNSIPSVECAILYVKEQAKQEINTGKYCSPREKIRISEKWNYL